MKLILFSDIHANLTAIKKCWDEHVWQNHTDGMPIILGDSINYGPRPNETVSYIKDGIKPKIWLSGNHEYSILSGDHGDFGTQRGIDAAIETSRVLTPKTIKTLKSNMINVYSKRIGNKNCLFIHGDLSDPKWGVMSDTEKTSELYSKYDFVFHGHTHVPSLVEVFYTVENSPNTRNTHKTIFINPGSVGQPRNNNKFAQYAVVDIITEEVIFHKVRYSIVEELLAYKTFKVDNFYKERLKFGI